MLSPLTILAMAAREHGPIVGFLLHVESLGRIAHYTTHRETYVTIVA